MGLQWALVESQTHTHLMADPTKMMEMSRVEMKGTWMNPSGLVESWTM